MYSKNNLGFVHEWVKVKHPTRSGAFTFGQGSKLCFQQISVKLNLKQEQKKPLKHCLAMFSQHFPLLGGKGAKNDSAIPLVS